MPSPPKSPAATVSLASLFTLTTAVAVVVWAVMYAPQLLCCFVVVALPAMLRLRDHLETAERVQHTLTLTEILVGYLGASLLSALCLLALSTAFFGTFATAFVIPYAADPAPIAFLLFLSAAFAAAGGCCYFLLGEVWLFPTRFAHAFGRLPGYREQLAQVFKAIALNVFVLGSCATVARWQTHAMPLAPGSRDELILMFLMFHALAQVAAASAAYQLARYQFNRDWVRALAGFSLAALFVGGALAFSPSSEAIANIPFGVVGGLLIALPFFRWPATPVRPEPRAAEILPPPKSPDGAT